MFKQFETVTATEYNSSTTTKSQDYFALAAAAEVFKGDPNCGQGGITGARTTAYSRLEEFNALTRFTWYETTSNRVKNNNGSAYNWWERSPYYGDGSYFCYVSSDGYASNTSAGGAYGLAPFGCL